MSTPAVSASPPSPQPLVVENAISRSDGNSFDLIIELRDQNGVAIDCSAYQPSEDFVQEVVPLVRACYAAYENTLSAQEKANPEELFTNAALIREREYCQIHQGQRVIDAGPFSLLPSDIARIQRVHVNFQGTNVTGAMDHLLSLFQGRSVERISQGEVRRPSTTSPHRSVASLPPVDPTRRAPESSGRAVPVNDHRLARVFPGANFGASATTDENQRRARAHCQAFLGKTFPIAGASLTITDVLTPSNENRQRIGALLGSCLNKIQNNQPFDADEGQLWHMLQEYLYCRRQNILHPWNPTLQREKERHQQQLTTYRFNGSLEAYLQFQLSCEFRDQIVQPHGINTPINPERANDTIIQQLWSFSPSN